MLIATLLWLAAGAPAAGEVRFTAEVDRTEVGLNETLVLTLTVSSDQEVSGTDIEPPRTGTLKVVSTSTSESMSFNFSGGSQQFTKMVNFHYVLQPTRPGKTRIGPATLTLKGRKYRTRPIDVRVVKGSTRPAPRSPLRRRFPGWLDDDWDDFFRQPDPWPRQQVGADDIFVRLHLQPDVAVEGQQLTATLRIYSRVGARVVSIRWPGLDDFFVVDRDVSRAATEQKNVSGRLYHTKVIDRRALFPLRSGQLELGAVEVEVETTMSPFYPSQTRTLKTRPRRITVMPLPGEGRPADFQPANVGQFAMSAAVDTTTPVLNQPVTFTLVLRGSGAIQRLSPPRLPKLAKFRVFDPTVSVELSKHSARVRGSKKIETILVPLASGRLTLPALTFSFYDPQQGRYRTLQTEPIELEVKAAGDAGSTASASGHQVNLVAGSFKPIRYEVQLVSRGRLLVDRAWFWPALALPPAAYLLVLLIGFMRLRSRADTRRNRQRQAWQGSRRHFKLAQRAATAGDAAGCFAELKRALLLAAEAKVAAPLQGLSIPEAMATLKNEGIAEQLAEKWRQEMENCDFGRFAPVAERGDSMQQSLARCREVLSELEHARATREVSR